MSRGTRRQSRPPTLKVAIAGATGYIGLELIRLLLNHEGVTITTLTAEHHAGRPIDTVFPFLKGQIDLVCQPLSVEALDRDADLIFTALPHGTSSFTVPALIGGGKRVIDLGADFRLQDARLYEHWYGVVHPHPELLPAAVYGLPELHGQRIRKASLVANPGCYPTSVILAVAPALRAGLIDPAAIVVDAKSGISGAGRTAQLDYSFAECHEGVRTYSLTGHRHIPEIEQEMGELAGQAVVISMTTHLIPMNRGILSTVYARLSGKVEEEELLACYQAFYRHAPFVRIQTNGGLGNTRDVRGSNVCQLGLQIDRRTGLLLVTSILDNLVKGGAGQAIQNMNLMCGFDEGWGLRGPVLFP